jgi:hypothetical protein
MLERSSGRCHTRRMAKPKRPRDANQLAKLIVDMATGEAAPDTTVHSKDPAAVALGRKGGLKGGKARAEKLPPARRREIAKKAALAKWRR